MSGIAMEMGADPRITKGRGASDAAGRRRRRRILSLRPQYGV